MPYTYAGRAIQVLRTEDDENVTLLCLLRSYVADCLSTGATVRELGTMRLGDLLGDLIIATPDQALLDIPLSDLDILRSIAGSLRDE